MQQPPQEPVLAGESVQSVKRALDILRMLSFSASSNGMRFSDLQAQSGLSKGTLHRLLKTLMAEGFVEQAAGSRVYFLGLDFAAGRAGIQPPGYPGGDPARIATAGAGHGRHCHAHHSQWSGRGMH